MKLIKEYSIYFELAVRYVWSFDGSSWLKRHSLNCNQASIAALTAAGWFCGLSETLSKQYIV